MDDRIEELPASICLQLLGSGNVGRVAVNGDPSPVVLPVNYVLRDEEIVFTTAGGTKWYAAREHAPASFEVDGVDQEHRSGWSVLVRGHLTALDSGDEAAAELVEAPEPLPGGTRPHVVRLSIDEVTGRRVPPDAAWTKAHRNHHTWTGQDGTDLLG